MSGESLTGTVDNQAIDTSFGQNRRYPERGIQEHRRADSYFQTGAALAKDEREDVRNGYLQTKGPPSLYPNPSR
jgi:hypothetical protein